MSSVKIKSVCILKANEDLAKTFELAIMNPRGKRIGTLRLIDKARTGDPTLAKNLTKWRNAASRFFLTQFNATEERTQGWLENIVLPLEDRILFELLDDAGRAIGHAGVRNLINSSCEMDNFIRGEPGGDPGLFVAAEITILRWLFCNLGIETVMLYVFSNNWIPISNHISIGFSIIGKHTLSRVEKNGMVQHLLDSQEGQPVKYAYLKMSISCNDFHSNQLKKHKNGGILT